MTLPPKPAIFLDRDGTLNQDIGYLYRVEDWQWLPDVQEALAAFYKAGYTLIVISNQSGIARGYYSHDDVTILHNWINKQLQPLQCKISAFYYCPHHPDITGPCTCRKPSAYMILQAAKQHNIDLTKSWMIGDKMIDMQAGQAAGCKTLLYTSHEQNKVHVNYKGQCITKLTDALPFICT